MFGGKSSISFSEFNSKNEATEKINLGGSKSLVQQIIRLLKQALPCTATIAYLRGNFDGKPERKFFNSSMITNATGDPKNLVSVGHAQKRYNAISVNNSPVSKIKNQSFSLQSPSNLKLRIRNGFN